MSRVRAADDFEAIRLRLEELRRERRQPAYRDEPIVEKPIREPDAVAHVPRHIVRRYISDIARRSSSR